MKFHPAAVINPPRLRAKAMTVDLVIAAAFVALWAVYPKIYVFSDPAGYLIRAYHLADIGDWGQTGYRLYAYGENPDARDPGLFPRDLRVGMLFPHWLSYQLFGASPAASFLPQLGFMLILLFAVLRYCGNPLQKVCAAFVLLRVFPHSVNAWPDLGLACFMFLALRFLDRRGDEGRGALHGFLFSLSLFYAGLIKLVAYFGALLYMGVAAVDLWRKVKKGRPINRPADGKPAAKTLAVFYLGSMVTGLALLAAYLVFSHYVHGDALARVARTSDTMSEAWTAGGIGIIPRRVFVEAGMAFYGLFGIAIVLAVAQSVIVLCRGGALKLVGVYLLAGIVFVIFTPTSLANWAPLPLFQEDSRYLLFLAPAVAVLSAKMISDLGLSDRFRGLWRVPARALGLACALVVAAHSGDFLRRDFSGKFHSEVENHRRQAIGAIKKNDNATLVLSDLRSHRSFILYAEFDERVYSRALLCDTAALLDDSRDIVVYIDWRMTNWRARHGRSNCNDELIASAAARGHTVAVNNDRAFLSFSAKTSSLPP